MACLKAFGVDAIRANAARDELMAWVRDSKPDLLANTFDRPFIPVSHMAMTQRVADEYEVTAIVLEIKVANSGC